MPKVSVIIPSYNHARYLRRRIDSVLNQTFQDMEVLILDDASTDSSMEIISSYRNDPRVQIVLNQINSGSPFPQWNKGVHLAKGSYIWIAEADDDCNETLLAKLVAKLDSDPAMVLAYAQSRVIDAHGQPQQSMAWWTDELDGGEYWARDFVADGGDMCARYMCFKNIIPNASAVLFRREAYLSMGGAPTNLRLCGDWSTWAKLIQPGRIAFISEELNFFRNHGGTVRTGTDRFAEIQEWLAVRKYIVTTTPPLPAIKRKFLTHTLLLWKSAAVTKTGRPTLAWLRQTTVDVSCITGYSRPRLAILYILQIIRVFLGLGRMKKWAQGFTASGTP